jgi:tetratricopeptide (TPR) repeat protein
VGSDEESTNEIDVEAMREALASSRRRAPEPDPSLERDTADVVTVAAPPVPATIRQSFVEAPPTVAPITPSVAPTTRGFAPVDSGAVTQPFRAEMLTPRLEEDELADVMEIEAVDDDDLTLPPSETPASEIAQALLTMVAEEDEPALDKTGEDLPPVEADEDPALDKTGEDLPAFSFDDPGDGDDDDDVITSQRSAATRTTAVFVGPPSTIARPSPEPSEHEAETRVAARVTPAPPSSEDVDLELDVAVAPPSSVESLALEVDDAEIELISEEAPTNARVETKPDAASELSLDDMDAEEAELLEAQRFGPLIALLRQRVGSADGPKTKAALLLRIARVYESGLGDPNEAFQTLTEAFELAPESGEIVAEVDRLGRATQRLGALADRVKKRLLPGSPDDKRVAYLGHLVYWNERVLGRSTEVSALVSEIERHDKVHPLVLRRAAQLAALNGDTKTQREHLLRALERTTRGDERAVLQVTLASTFGGGPDAIRYYEAALEDDPTSSFALLGLKRLAREKESYDRVLWVLERQVAVAESDADRIDALLELAELQETKFLKREVAADLLEQVLTIQATNPAALKALERCYHALRDWPRLARILSLRASETTDKKTKRELLERAAEVHESKLGDPAGAVDVYLDLLVVDPSHRRALGDLARLHEKLADWPKVALYKGRLAELAPTKRVTSQELVKLGDFLNVPERDPAAAKLQYERSVAVDPTNTAGWEALQKLASEAGNHAKVIECLEQRRKHTEIPRQRAAVLVELGKLHRERGDADVARQAFEAAIKTDASNEAAAIAMLDTFTAEAKWAQAAPLCELLVNAAIRDRDDEALFIRLRLATRIAAALGDADRAMLAAVAAFDARPTDPGARSDLLTVASQCRESAPAALAKGRAQLARLAEEPGELLSTPDNLLELAILERDGGNVDRATKLLERLRREQPEDANVMKELAALYLAQGDFPRACKLKVDMARNATSADLRFDLLCEAGEIWARRADELELAVPVLEEARGLRPLDPWLLDTLAWLYGELDEWDRVAAVLGEKAQATAAAPERVKILLALVEVVRDRLGDRARAADLFDELLDVDKKRLDVFEELVRIVTEDKDWERLERAYVRMIDRVRTKEISPDDDESNDDDGDAQLEFVLLQQLGLIYRDRLDDAARAFDALDTASRLRPADAEVRKIIVELLVVTDNLDNAVARLRDELERDPHDAALYAELYELFLRQHAFDKAWCAVNVVARLGDPTPEQRRFHEDYPPMPLDGVPGQIVEKAWLSHILHSQLDPLLTRLFALITPVVARMRFGQQRPEQRVGRPFTASHSRLYDVVRTTFDNAAEILSIPSPELLLGDTQPGFGGGAFGPALSPFGATLVSAVVESQAPSLVYLVGKRLADARIELAARAFFPSVAELTSVLQTATRVSRNEVARDPAGAALDQSFAASLAPQDATTLRALVVELARTGAPDIKAWLRAADLSSTRAGLLIAGDVEPARSVLLAEAVQQGGPAGELLARDRIGELYKFATSDLYAELRAAIGVAVEA